MPRKRHAAKWTHEDSLNALLVEKQWIEERLKQLDTAIDSVRRLIANPANAKHPQPVETGQKSAKTKA